MIQVLNGGLVTSVAGEETLVPSVPKEDSGFQAAGRHTFFFILVSGSVQMSVGASTSPGAGYTQSTYSTAGDKWFVTAAPEMLENGLRNIRIKGAGTFNIFW